MTIQVRPIEPSDRDLLLQWRNATHVRAVSVDDRPIAAEAHEAWFERALHGATDGEIDIVAVNSSPVGLVRVEHVDATQSTGAWACHLGERAVPPGLGAALPVIGLAIGFGPWRLRRMAAEVLSVNKNMRGIHRRLGLAEEGVRREALRRSTAELLDIHEYGVLATEWPALRSRLLDLLPPVVRTDLTSLLATIESRATLHL